MAALQQDVRSARASLQSAIIPLRVELAVWARLLYKNHNQHRRGVYFRRMQHVRRAFATVTPLLDTLECALAAFATEKPKTAQTALECVLCTGAALHTACAAALVCARHMLNMLASGYFLPLSLAATAVCARLVHISRNLMGTLAPLAAEYTGLTAVARRTTSTGGAASMPSYLWLSEPREASLLRAAIASFDIHALIRAAGGGGGGGGGKTKRSKIKHESDRGGVTSGFLTSFGQRTVAIASAIVLPRQLPLPLAPCEDGIDDSDDNVDDGHRVEAGRVDMDGVDNGVDAGASIMNSGDSSDCSDSSDCNEDRDPRLSAVFGRSVSGCALSGDRALVDIFAERIVDVDAVVFGALSNASDARGADVSQLVSTTFNQITLVKSQPFLNHKQRQPHLQPPFQAHTTVPSQPQPVRAILPSRAHTPTAHKVLGPPSVKSLQRTNTHGGFIAANTSTRVHSAVEQITGAMTLPQSPTAPPPPPYVTRIDANKLKRTGTSEGDASSNKKVKIKPTKPKHDADDIDDIFGF